MTGIAHRDMKPENILITPRAEELLKYTAQASLCSCPTETSPGGSPEPDSACFKCSKRQLLQQLASGEKNIGEATAQQSTGNGLSINTSLPNAGSLRKAFLAKMCDFGAAFCGEIDVSNAAALAKSPCGSVYYCAPEVARLMKFDTMPAEAELVWGIDRSVWTAVRERGYNPFPTDVWSYGMMLFTLTTGLKPFHSACVSDVMFRAFILATQPDARHHELCAPHSGAWTSDTAPRRWRWPKRLSPALVALIGACLRIEPQERVTMEQVCNHPWFAVGSSEARDVLPSLPPPPDDSTPPAGGMPNDDAGIESSDSPSELTQQSQSGCVASAAFPPEGQVAAFQGGAGGGRGSAGSDTLSAATSHRSFQGKRRRAGPSGPWHKGGGASNSLTRSGSSLSGGAWSDTSSLGGGSQYSANAALSRLSDLTDEAPLYRGKRSALPPVVESPHGAAAASARSSVSARSTAPTTAAAPFHTAEPGTTAAAAAAGGSIGAPVSFGTTSLNMPGAVRSSTGPALRLPLL